MPKLLSLQLVQAKVGLLLGYYWANFVDDLSEESAEVLQGMRHLASADVGSESER